MHTFKDTQDVPWLESSRSRGQTVNCNEIERPQHHCGFNLMIIGRLSHQ